MRVKSKKTGGISNLWANLWCDLWVAIGFFTRFPIPQPVQFSKNALANASWAFALAGLPVAATGSLIFWLTHYLGLSGWIGALLAVVGCTIATGALHEDGLADFVDGIWGGFTPERRLEIMRDSHIGGYGTLALILAIGLKVSTLSGLAPDQIFACLAACHCLSRGLLAPVMHFASLAGKSGLAAQAGRPDRINALIGGGLGSLIALALLGPLAGLSLLVIALLSNLLLIMLAKSKIGGYNGDTLGAIQQICEIAGLITYVAWFA